MLISSMLGHCRVACAVLFFSVCLLFPMASLAGDPITVTYCGDCIPFQFTNDAGDADGIIMDYWKLWSRKTGTPIEYKPAGWNETIALVRDGKVDAHAGLGFNDQRDTFLEYGSRLSNTSTNLFFSKNIQIPQKILDIKAYRIGVLSGDIAEDYLKTSLPTASIIPFPTYDAMMAALKQGDLMVFAADTPTGLYHLTKAGLSGDFQYDASQPLYNSPWYVASTEGRGDMVQRISKGMELISREERKAIARRWASPDGDVDTSAIIIPYMADYPPLMMTGLDGKPTGFLIDMWKLWSKATGLPIQFKAVSWKETLSSIRREEADIHPGLFKSSERETWMVFSKPIMDIKTALYFREGRGKPVPLSQMKGRRVGVMSGSFQQEFVQAKYPDVEVVPFTHNEELIIGLLKGQVDAIVNEIPTVEADLSRFSLQGAVRRYKDSLFGNGLHAGVLKQNEKLLKQVNDGLAAIPEEEKARLERRWFPNASERFYKVAGLDESLELTESEREWLRNNQLVKVGVTSFITPIDILDKNGLYTGLNAEIIEKLNSYLRINLAPVFHDKWGDVVNDAVSGKLPCVMSFSKTPERAKTMLFTEPYALDPVIVVVRDNDDSVKAWKDLKGKTVSVVKGASMYDEVYAEVGSGKVVDVEDEAQGLALLESGTVDAHVSWLIPYGNAQRANEVPGLKVALRRVSETGTLRIGVHKSQPELYSILSKGLRRIPSKDLDALKERWLAPPKTRKAARIELTPEERAWIKKHPTIWVGGTPDWPPFEYVEDDRYTGVSADFLRLAAKRAGLKLEYEVDTFNIIVDKLKKKDIDLSPAMAKTPERDEFLVFTKPYITSDDAIFVMKGRDDITSLDDLKGKLVAVEKSYFTEEFLRTKYPEIKRVIVPSTHKALKMVSSGQADAYVGVQAVASYLLDKFLMTNLKVTGFVEGKTTELRVGIKKDYTTLKSILDKAYASISMEERNEIVGRYFHANGKQDGKRVALTPEESKWLAGLAKPVVVGAETDWPPFDFVKDDKATGYSNELLRIAAQKAGLPIRFMHGFTWTELVDKFRADEIDILPVIYNTAERRKEMALTEMYASVPQVLVVSESIKGSPSLKQLSGKRIAILDGSTLSDSLKKQFPELEQVPVGSTLDGLKAVSMGKADAMVDSLGPVAYLLKENYMPGVRIVDEVWLKGMDASQFHVGVKKGRTILRDILQKGLDAVTEKEKNALKEEWLGLGEAQGRRAKVKLTDQERKWLSGAKPVRMSVDPSWLPIERINRETGEYEGIAAEYIHLITDVTGLKFELVPTDKWSHSVKLAKEGKTDMLVAASKTKEREAFLNFSLPYITLSNAVVMRNDAPFVNDIRDLVGMRVGVGDGNSMHRYLEANHPDLTLVPNKGTLNGLQMVANGEVDAYVGTLEVMGYLINNNGLFNLKVALKLPMSRELHMAVRKDVDPEVLSIINKALESVTPEEKSSIFRTWISLRVEEKFDFTLIYKIGLPVGGVILLIIGIITIWNRRLAKEIEERKVVEARLKDAFGVITSSIKYASRIQRSVLPPAQRMRDLTADHFVIWEPRDVVGGDMYWCELWGEGSVIVLGDCTGHGVPGAFMTLLATGALKRSLSQVPEGDAAGLIAAMHKSLQSQLSQNCDAVCDTSSDDGLELGICYLAPDNNTVTYAGARMQLFVDRGEEIEIVKGDRKGIAYRGIPHDFEYTNKTITLEDDMRFFMATDGIIDQVGGEKRRGFGRKRFVSLLNSVRGASMREQGETIHVELVAYQGDEKRRDDVAIIGFTL